MELINKLARAALHDTIKKMLTPEKIEDVASVISQRMIQEKTVENIARDVLMTLRAGLLEMTAKPEPPEPPPEVPK